MATTSSSATARSTTSVPCAGSWRRRGDGSGRRSDTEVALEALACWGDDALARLEGMFALAWYRPQERRLVLARDTMGIKPLHWWHDGGTTVFGSQYDQVVRHRRCDRSRVDGRRWSCTSASGCSRPRTACSSGPDRLRRGTRSTSTRPAGSVARPFRVLPTAPPVGERLVGAAADEAVAAAVDAAVERQMVSDVPLGVFLSGGVDSPLVAASAAEHPPAALTAFSIGTDDPSMDESVAASRPTPRPSASTTGCARSTGSEALALVDDVARAYTEPFGDYSSFPTLMVAALAGGEVKTVLSGDGGDELLWGYPRFAKVRRARPWFRLPRAARLAAYGLTKPAPDGSATGSRHPLPDDR